MHYYSLVGRSLLLVEEWTWDETPDDDPDGTIEFDADLAFELQGDR